MKTKKLLAIFALSVLLSLASFATAPRIKVGINFGSTAVYGGINISFENGFQAGNISADGVFSPAATFSKNEIMISTSGSNLSVTVGGVSIYDVINGGELAILPLPGTSAIPYSKIGSIKYPEVLKFTAYGGGITIINVVEVEQYLKGVLPSEIYPSWHEEALKAAAIATRTYTYHSINSKHSEYGVDLCATTCCQVYSGITKCQDSTNKAIDDTKNLVLTYKGKPITAVYHAISGGVTETAAGAWGGKPENYPYLTVVETPFENYEEIARGKWTKVLYEPDFSELIAASSYNGKISSAITDISIDDATPGYLNNVTITDAYGKSITLKTSSQVRSFFKVISANFTIGNAYMPQNTAGDNAKVVSAYGEKTLTSGTSAVIMTANGKETVAGVKNAYFIDGKGYGHGVGMSQYGTQYAAKAGYTHRQILSIYYPGTTIEDYTTLGQ